MAELPQPNTDQRSAFSADRQRPEDFGEGVLLGCSQGRWVRHNTNAPDHDPGTDLVHYWCLENSCCVCSNGSSLKVLKWTHLGSPKVGSLYGFWLWLMPAFPNVSACLHVLTVELPQFSRAIKRTIGPQWAHLRWILKPKSNTRPVGHLQKWFTYANRSVEMWCEPLAAHHVGTAPCRKLGVNQNRALGETPSCPIG